MTESKNLGIWMDHSSAHLVEFFNNSMETKTLESDLSHPGKSENVMHNKEQNEQHAYYHKLGEIIKKYDKVLLFGPTDAKAELHNLLKEDTHFANVHFEVKQADKMTDNQQHAFVKAHFSGN